MPTETGESREASQPADAAGADPLRHSVGVMLPLALLEPYDYLVPAGMVLQRGDFVTVPLGRRSVTGIVWGAALGNVDPAKLKPVAAQLPLPPLPQVSLAFIDWVAQYCMAPAGAVLRMAMSVPDALQPEPAHRAWTIAGTTPAPGMAPRLTATRQRVLELLRHAPPLPPVELARLAGVSAGVFGRRH